MYSQLDTQTTNKTGTFDHFFGEENWKMIMKNKVKGSSNFSKVLFFKNLRKLY